MEIPEALERRGLLRPLLADVEFWTPWLEVALSSSGIPCPEAPVVAGHNATYPTFVLPEVVLKFFGGHDTWAESYEAECRALQALEQTPEVPAPRVLAQGELFPGAPTSWPYLVMTRVPGHPLRACTLDPAQETRLARQLGRVVASLQGLAVPDLPTPPPLPPELVVDGCRRSSLPGDLLEQIPGFLETHPGGEPGFVHGDLVRNHVYLDEDGSLVGIIDWGDALRADPHLEVGKLYFGALARRRDLFGAFLDACGWGAAADFAPRALAQTLRRQALGLLQHRGFDVFDGLEAVVPPGAAGDLERLAQLLFGSDSRA